MRSRLLLEELQSFLIRRLELLPLGILAEHQVDLYLADRFGLAEGGDPVALARRGIRLALVREPSVRAALDASPHAELVRTWPDWALYRFRPGAAISGR